MVATTCGRGGYSPHRSQEANTERDEGFRDKIYSSKAYPQ
jgi:hypothetical protein